MKIIVTLVLAFTSCKAIPPNIPQDAVDCIKADHGKINSLINEFLPVVSGGNADWSVIEQRAESAGLEIGGCFLAELIQQYMGGTKAPPHEQGLAAHEALKTFKAKNHVTTFSTAAGKL